MKGTFSRMKPPKAPSASPPTPTRGSPPSFLFSSSFCLQRQKDQKRRLRERGFRFPLSLKNPYPLKRPKEGRCCGTPLLVESTPQGWGTGGEAPISHAKRRGVLTPPMLLSQRFYFILLFQFFYFSSTTVTPASPSPKLPRRKLLTSLLRRRSSWTALRKAPVPLPWMMVTVPSLARRAASR